MLKDKAGEIQLQIEQLMEDIDEADPDDSDFWTELYWRLKEMTEDIREYYRRSV